MAMSNNNHAIAQQANAGADMSIGNHATTISATANTAQNILIKDAADKYLSTISNNAADGYHSTTQKHAADKYLSTITHANVITAQNILIKDAATTLPNITSNAHATHAAEMGLVLATLAVAAQMEAAHNKEIILL